MKLIITFLSILFLISGCKKSEDGKHFFSGYLYNQCGGSVIKNKALIAFQSSPNQQQIIGSTTTDSNGYFRLDYYTIQSSKAVEIRYAASNFPVLRYDADSSRLKNLENLKIYANPTSTTVVRLNVINAYTNQDTIEASRGYPPNLKFAGPFVNGVLYTISNLEIITPNFKNGKVTYSDAIAYRINAGSFKTVPVDFVACETQQVTLKIE